MNPNITPARREELRQASLNARLSLAARVEDLRNRLEVRSMPYAVRDLTPGRSVSDFANKLAEATEALRIHDAEHLRRFPDGAPTVKADPRDEELARLRKNAAWSDNEIARLRNEVAALRNP